MRTKYTKKKTIYKSNNNCSIIYNSYENVHTTTIQTAKKFACLCLKFLMGEAGFQFGLLTFLPQSSCIS